MPLLDAFGREIAHRVRSPKPRRPKRKPVVPRVPHTPPRNLNQLVEMSLTTRHNVGGELYGPGPVKVPRAVAQVLAEGERRASWCDANFAGTRACIIGPGNRKGALGVREVAPEIFDLPYVAAVPFGVVGKTGLFQESLSGRGE